MADGDGGLVDDCFLAAGGEGGDNGDFFFAEDFFLAAGGEGGGNGDDGSDDGGEGVPGGP